MGVIFTGMSTQVELYRCLNRFIELSFPEVAADANFKIPKLPAANGLVFVNCVFTAPDVLYILKPFFFIADRRFWMLFQQAGELKCFTSSLSDSLCSYFCSDEIRDKLIYGEMKSTGTGSWGLNFVLCSISHASGYTVWRRGHESVSAELTRVNIADFQEVVRIDVDEPLLVMDLTGSYRFIQRPQETKSDDSDLDDSDGG